MNNNNDASSPDSKVTVLDKKQLAAQVMNNPEALALMQSKLAGMVGTMSGYYDTLPQVVKRRVKALKKIQVESLKIEAEIAEAIHELECKFASRFESLYGKRAQIISGDYEPKDEECDFPSDVEDEEEDGEGEGEGDAKKEKTVDGKADGEGDKKDLDLKAVHGMDENTKGIPEFWLTIFKNVDLIADNIQEHDEPILAHLIDIQVKMHSKPTGFTLEFYFSPNDYFTNSVLTKYYELKCEVDPEDPFSFEGQEIKSCKGCEINWKKGKNVTVRTVTKKQKHKSKGNVRSVQKQVQNDSFFNFFAPPEVPLDDEDIDDDTQAILAADFEIGEVIRQRIVQRAVLYFTGEALDDDDYDDEEDEEDDEECSDEDEEEDEDYEPPKGGKGAKAGKGGKNPEECKQQ